MIVSDGGLNRVVVGLGRGVATVVPITARAEHAHAFPMFLAAHETGLPADGKAQAEQVRAVDIGRPNVGVIGSLMAGRLRQLDAALRPRLVS